MGMVINKPIDSNETRRMGMDPVQGKDTRERDGRHARGRRLVLGQRDLLRRRVHVPVLCHTDRQHHERRGPTTASVSALFRPFPAPCGSRDAQPS